MINLATAITPNQIFGNLATQNTKQNPNKIQNTTSGSINRQYKCYRHETFTYTTNDEYLI